MYCDCPACGAECQSADISAGVACCPECGRTFTPPPVPPDVVYGDPPPGLTPVFVPVRITRPLPDPATPPPSRPRPSPDAIAALGPPPPYRTIELPPKPRPPPVQMAAPPRVRPDANRVNIRAIGVLGPPPPYRPIVQAGQAFQRGPAPDLEPWREETLAQPLPVISQTGPIASRAARDQDDALEMPEWSIRRDPAFPPERESDAAEWEDLEGFLVPPPAPEPRAPGRFSRLLALLRRRRAYDEESEPLPRRPRRRRWIVIGLVVLVTATGVAGLYLGRWRIMKTIPITRPLYQALGLRGGQAPAESR